jgi:DNA-binding transcriptional MerR regulator
LKSPECSEDRLLPPGQVRKLYGVAASTLRDWDSTGRLRAAQRTLGGHRRYWESEVRALAALQQAEAVA